MSFGLKNAPSTLKRMMGHFLAEMNFARVYQDDLIVFTNNFEEHLEHFSAVTIATDKYGLKLKLPKCHIERGQIDLLCDLVEWKRVRMDLEKVEAIQPIHSAVKVTQVRSFLGLGG